MAHIEDTNTPRRDEPENVVQVIADEREDLTDTERLECIYKQFRTSWHAFHE